MTVTIVEYSQLAQGNGNQGLLPIPQDPPSAAPQTAITLSGTSQQSAAFAASTNYIEITSDEAFRFLIGSSPTATANCSMLPATTGTAPHYRAVKPGMKIALLQV